MAPHCTCRPGGGNPGGVPPAGAPLHLPTRARSGSVIGSSSRGSSGRVSGPTNDVAVYVGVVTPGWSETELDLLIEDVLVDAYGDSERLCAFECAFEECGLPAAAEVIGRACMLESVDYTGDERRGLVASVTIDGSSHKVGLVDVEITDHSHDARAADGGVQAMVGAGQVTGNGSEDALAAALAEIAMLRVENERLRGLLGLTAGRSADPPVAWEPTLFAPPLSERPIVDRRSPSADKIALFRALFSGRDDVFALRWQNDRTGRSGWSPAVVGGWANSKRPDRSYEPLTDAVIERHLAGEIAAGMYPLLRDDRCRSLACDFDKGTWVLDALAYLDACHANGVPAALERSRSGNGGHVWVFFDGPVAAADARSRSARRCCARRWRLEPSWISPATTGSSRPRTYLPKAGFGNLIALPLQGECRRRGNTCSSTRRRWSRTPTSGRSSRRSLGCPEALRSDSRSPASARSMPRRGLAELPARRSQPRRRSRARLGRCCRSSGPVCLPRLHRGAEAPRRRSPTPSSTRSSGCGSRLEHPRFISCYGEDLEWLHLPRGLTERPAIFSSVSEAGSTLNDDRTDPDGARALVHDRVDARQQAAVGRVSSVTTAGSSSPRPAPARP